MKLKMPRATCTTSMGKLPHVCSFRGEDFFLVEKWRGFFGKIHPKVSVFGFKDFF